MIRSADASLPYDSLTDTGMMEVVDGRLMEDGDVDRRLYAVGGGRVSSGP